MDTTRELPVDRDVTEPIPIPETTQDSDPVVPAPPLDRRRFVVWAAIASVFVLFVFGWINRGSLPPVPSTTPPPTTPVTAAPPPTTAAIADTPPPSPGPKHGKKKG